MRNFITLILMGFHHASLLTSTPLIGFSSVEDKVLALPASSGRNTQPEKNLLEYSQRDSPDKESSKPCGEVTLHCNYQGSEISPIMRGINDPVAHRRDSLGPSFQNRGKQHPDTPYSLKVKMDSGKKHRGRSQNYLSPGNRMNTRACKQVEMLQTNKSLLKPISSMDECSSESSASKQCENTDSSTDSLNNGMHKAQKLSGAYMEDIERRIWPWISTIWTTVDQSIAQDIIDKIRLSMPILMMSFHKDVSKSSVDLFQRGKEFACLLWTLNLRALQIIEPDESKLTYLEEQTNFMKWFCDCMFRLIYPTKSRLPLLQEDQGPLLESIYQDTLEAIHTPRDQPSYKVFLDKSKDDPIFVSQDQVLMSKAAVSIIILYLKHTHHDQWEQLIGEEEDFVIKISNFEFNWIEKLFGISEDMTEDHNTSEILPWGSDLSPLEYSPKNEKYLKFKFSDHVEPILSSPGRQIETLNSKKNQLDNPKDVYWVWILRLTLKGNVKPPATSKENSFWLERNIRSYLDVEIEKLHENQKLQFEINYMEHFSEKINKVFDYLYCTTENFIRYLGFKGADEMHHKEQKSIKHHLESVFSTPQNNSSEIKYHEETREKIGNLFKRLFLLKGDEPVYKVQRSKRTPSITTDVTMDDIIMMEIVLNIIQSHYKNSNRETWRALFIEDSWFFHLLMKLSSDDFNRHSSQCGRRIKKYFKENKIFPWEISKLRTPLPREVQNLIGPRDRSDVYNWIKKDGCSITRNLPDSVDIE